MQGRAIDEVLEMYTEDIMSVPGVQGTGLGLYKEHPCIHVFISEKRSETLEAIPREIEGYKVRAVVSGEVFPLDD